MPRTELQYGLNRLYAKLIILQNIVMKKINKIMATINTDVSPLTSLNLKLLHCSANLSASDWEGVLNIKFIRYSVVLWCTTVIISNMSNFLNFSQILSYCEREIIVKCWCTMYTYNMYCTILSCALLSPRAFADAPLFWFIGYFLCISSNLIATLKV